MIAGTGKSEIRNSGKSWCCGLESECLRASSWKLRQGFHVAIWGRIYSSLRNLSLLRSSADGMSHPHTVESKLLYSKSTDLIVNNM